ncbi:MAG TPA: hypothetical protein VHY91_21960 [Pirellulales bacterium]|nr:hypothetical protein [Pirellulales bacterium]
MVAAASAAGKAHADGGPPPLFLAPRTTSEISAPVSSDIEQASRERLKERAAAVSNPNLKWKPYRPAAKPEATKPVIAKPEATEPAKAKSVEANPVRKAQATATSRRASKIAADTSHDDSAETDAVADSETDAVADAAPARRAASRASRSQLRSQILQVDQREKPEPFSEPFQSEPAPAPMDRGPAPGANEAESGSPRTIAPADEPFPEETLPMPAEIGGGNYEATTPSSAESLGCANEKSECAQALKRLQATTIDKININIAVSGREGTDFPCECELSGVFTDRKWDTTLFTWKASALCHKPLYFEEVGLERYGHSLNPFWQPIFSGIHFFATIPVLPYMMGVYPPNECQYVLGYYRMGDCAPYMIPPIPFSVRGAFFEAVGVVCPILIVH